MDQQSIVCPFDLIPIPKFTLSIRHLPVILRDHPNPIPEDKDSSAVPPAIDFSPEIFLKDKAAGAVQQPIRGSSGNGLCPGASAIDENELQLPHETYLDSTSLLIQYYNSTKLVFP